MELPLKAASTEGADSSPISWGAGGSSACKREWPTSMGVFQGTPEAASRTESYFTENSRWMKCMHPGPWIGASAYLAWVAGLSLWGGWPAAYFHSAYLGSNNGWTLFIDFSTFWNNIVKKKKLILSCVCNLRQILTTLKETITNFDFLTFKITCELQDIKLDLF